jgi:signal transduction histidine kinase
MVYIFVSEFGYRNSEEEMQKKFRPFQQIDTGTTRKHEGPALALSICNKLVEFMGFMRDITTAI